MTDPKDEGKLTDEMRQLGDSIFQLGRTAFQKGRVLSIGALKRARQTIDSARDELEKAGKPKE